MNFLMLESLNKNGNGTCRFLNLDHVVEIIVPNDCTGGSIKDVHGKMHILREEQVTQLLEKLNLPNKENGKNNGKSKYRTDFSQAS